MHAVQLSDIHKRALAMPHAVYNIVKHSNQCCTMRSHSIENTMKAAFKSKNALLLQEPAKINQGSIYTAPGQPQL